MALAYALEGGANMIVTRQSIAAAETITLDGKKINGGYAYSILGGTVEVITSAAGSIDIRIDGASILATPLLTNSPGNYNLILGNLPSALQGKAGDDITIVTSASSACQVTLFLSGSFESLV